MTRYVIVVRAVDRGEQPELQHVEEEFRLEVEVPDNAVPVLFAGFHVEKAPTVMRLAAFANDAIRDAIKEMT